MNKKVAIGLILGALLAVAAGLLTAEKSYYYYILISSPIEVSKEFYESGPPSMTKKEVTYNPIFMAIGFLGGMGIGYFVAAPIDNAIKRKRQNKEGRPDE